MPGRMQHGHTAFCRIGLNLGLVGTTGQLDRQSTLDKVLPVCMDAMLSPVRAGMRDDLN